MLTSSCLSPHKQSALLTVCQVLFETISTHGPLKHARPIKNRVRQTELCSCPLKQKVALPGVVWRTRTLGTPKMQSQVALFYSVALPKPTNHTYTFTPILSFFLSWLLTLFKEKEKTFSIHTHSVCSPWRTP